MGVLATNGDTLVMGSGGGKGVMVMLTDYSSGNDMVVGKPGVKTLKDLKGRKWPSRWASWIICCC